jgi:hypothetical protein
MELHSLYTSSNIIRVIRSRSMRWVRHVARMVGLKIAYNIFVGKPGRKRPLGRPRRRWENNIRMDLGETEWDVVDWMHLAHDRNQWGALVNTVMNVQVP